MKPANVNDLLESLSATGVTIEAHGASLRYRPASAMTPDLLAAVKSCKDDLLELLKFPGGPGAGSDNSGVAEPTLARTTFVESISQTTRLGDDPKVDAEFRRFEQVAERMPGGGWYCPVHGSSEMPRGATGEQWDALVADLGRPGKRNKA